MKTLEALGIDENVETKILPSEYSRKTADIIRDALMEWTDQSFIDFDIGYNADETINNFYINENDSIDFSGEEFNKTRKIFTSLTEPTDNEENLKGTDRDLLPEESINVTFNFRNLGEYKWFPQIPEAIKDATKF